MGIPDTGDTAWMLISAALVLLMTPGLAFFYGGMVRAKSVLNMMMMSFGAMGVVGDPLGAVRLLVAFGDDIGGVFGDPFAVLRPQGHHRRRLLDRSRTRSDRPRRIPLRRHRPGDRLRRLPGDVRDHHRRADLRRGRRPGQVRRLAAVRGPLGDFRVLPGRALGVLVRRRHRRDSGGWIANKLKAIDFAGGTAVHINAGTAALVLAHRARQAQGLARRRRCGRTTCRS